MSQSGRPYGNQNISAFGPLQRLRPGRCSASAARQAAPSTTPQLLGGPTTASGSLSRPSMWSRHPARQVVRTNPAFRFVNVYRVVSNLGVDFGGPDRSMRAVSYTPKLTPSDVTTPHCSVHDLDAAKQTRLPTDDELFDPRGNRSKSLRGTGDTIMIDPPPLPASGGAPVPCKRWYPHCIVGGGCEAAYAADRAHRHQSAVNSCRPGWWVAGARLSTTANAAGWASWPRPP